MKKGPEKRWEDKIRRNLTKAGAAGNKTFSGQVFTKGGRPVKTQPSGTPDLIYCLNGVYLAIEVKSAVGHPSDEQLIHLHDIDAAGGIACISYDKPADREQMLALIKDSTWIPLNPIARNEYLKATYPLLYKWQKMYDRRHVDPDSQ